MVKKPSKIKKNTKKVINTKKVAFLLLIAVFIISIFALNASAGPLDSINSFFKNDGYKNHDKLIDFAIFFTLFFSVCYISFSKVFGEGFGQPGSAKGPVVGLSVALALMFSFGLITQLEFSITKMFPLAKAMLMLVIVLLLYGLFSNEAMIGKDTLTKKFIALMLAILVGYLLFSIGTHIICQVETNMNDPACQGGIFTAVGQGVSKLFGGVGAGGTTKIATTGTGTTTIPDASNLIQGECRLDGTFNFDKTTYSTQGNMAEYVKKVNAIGKKTIYVYGFASTEGQEVYNKDLSKRRAETATKDLQAAANAAGLKITIKVASGKGETNMFSASYPPNRRYVATTTKILGFMPSPGLSGGITCLTSTPSSSTTSTSSSASPMSPDVKKGLLLQLQNELDLAESELKEGKKNKDAAKISLAIKKAEEVKKKIAKLR